LNAFACAASAVLRFSAGRRLLAAALWVGAAALPAQAAIVVGTFDPPFGPLIPNLGFRGSVVVSVPDACFALPAGFIPNADACSGNTMSLLSATVDLYNINTPGLPTLLTLPFSFVPGSFNGVVTGFSGVTNQNELLGVDTAFSTVLPVALFDAGPTAAVGDDVAFTGTLKLRLFAVPPVAQVPGNEPFYGAMMHGCLGENPGATNGGCADSQLATIVFATRPKVTSPLPEPGTLPLLALGVLGALATRRGLMPRR
jgi:hypothetical protein